MLCVKTLLLSPLSLCVAGEKPGARARLPLWGDRVKTRQSHCLCDPACLAEHLSTHPLLSHRSAPWLVKATSHCESPQTAIAEQKTIVVQPSATSGNKSRLRDQAGEGRLGVLFSSFMARSGKYEVGMGGFLCRSIRGKLFAAGVQKSQSHVAKGRGSRAAPGQNWRMLSPVLRAAELHSRTKL